MSRFAYLDFDDLDDIENGEICDNSNSPSPVPATLKEKEKKKEKDSDKTQPSLLDLSKQCYHQTFVSRMLRDTHEIETDFISEAKSAFTKYVRDLFILRNVDEYEVYDLTEFTKFFSEHSFKLLFEIKREKAKLGIYSWTYKDRVIYLVGIRDVGCCSSCDPYIEKSEKLNSIKEKVKLYTKNLKYVQGRYDDYTFDEHEAFFKEYGFVNAFNLRESSDFRREMKRKIQNESIAADSLMKSSIDLCLNGIELFLDYVSVRDYVYSSGLFTRLPSLNEILRSVYYKK